MDKLANHTNAVSHVLEHRQTAETRLTLYWLKVGKYTTSNYNAAKLLQFPAVISGNNLFEYTTIDVFCVDELCREERETAIDVANRLIAALD